MANDEVRSTPDESKENSLAKILDHAEIDLEQPGLKERAESWDIEDAAGKEVEEGYCVECEGQVFTR
jgi:hypothetical protein